YFLIFERQVWQPEDLAMDQIVRLLLDRTVTSSFNQEEPHLLQPDIYNRPSKCYYPLVSDRHDAIGQENFKFLDDNARAHRAAIVMAALEDLQISYLSLPLRFPDLNVIEHVWLCFKGNLTTIYCNQIPTENLQI
ncbi:hypothetical protein ANN_01001, partial [Periplaneta americana]